MRKLLSVTLLLGAFSAGCARPTPAQDPGAIGTATLTNAPAPAMKLGLARWDDDPPAAPAATTLAPQTWGKTYEPDPNDPAGTRH